MSTNPDSINDDEIVSLITKEMIEEKSKKKEEPKEEEKLYLNTRFFIFVKKVVRSIVLKVRKNRDRINLWWQKETTKDLRDVVKFVIIHGFLVGMLVCLILTITNSQLLLIKIIRSSILSTLVVLMLGSGSLYYIFIDMNKILTENWKRKR